jgi:16S rRNA G966 N2-methylase RsmD
VFVERDREAARTIQANLEKLRLTGATVSARDVAAVLREERGRGRRYDLVLVDPPYDEWALHASPLAELIPAVLADGGLVVVETDERVEPDLPLALVTTRRYGSARITVYSR